MPSVMQLSRLFALVMAVAKSSMSAGLPTI